MTGRVSGQVTSNDHADLWKEAAAFARQRAKSNIRNRRSAGDWARLRAANVAAGNSRDGSASDLDPLTRALHTAAVLGVAPPPPPTEWKTGAKVSPAGGDGLMPTPRTAAIRSSRLARARAANQTRRGSEVTSSTHAASEIPRPRAITTGEVSSPEDDNAMARRLRWLNEGGSSLVRRMSGGRISGGHPPPLAYKQVSVEEFSSSLCEGSTSCSRL